MDEEQIVVVSRNVIECKLAAAKLEEANEMLLELSLRDGLTGIWNRRAYDERLVFEWRNAINHKTPLSIIMIDIDLFKLYNDEYGHHIGDECLRKVASTLQTSLTKETDFVGRFGGEEFSAILPNTTAEEACSVAELMRKNIAELKIDHRQSTVSEFVTISLGVY